MRHLNREFILPLFLNAFKNIVAYLVGAYSRIVPTWLTIVLIHVLISNALLYVFTNPNPIGFYPIK